MLQIPNFRCVVNILKSEKHARVGLLNLSKSRCDFMPALLSGIYSFNIGDCEGLWDSRPGREHIPDEKQTNGWICCARCGLLLLVIPPTGLPEGQPSASGRRETKETTPK